jgi:uncharacterized protein
MASRVVHFEIPSSNPEAASSFYGSAFGWQITKWDGPMDYWLVKTGEGDPGIDGGIMRKDGPFDRVINTIAVSNLDEACKRVTDLGGTLAGEKLKIENIGDLQYAADPDGNLFGMLQPVEAALTTGTA